jgi:hypothetical protein
MSTPPRRYILDPPIVLDRRPKKKKRSPSMRDAQEMERHFSRAVHRSIKAADKGMATYRKARKKSAARQRDGALVDFVPNMLRGSATTIRGLSLVPIDLLRAAYTPQARRITRRAVRSMARMTDDLLDE